MKKRGMILAMVTVMVLSLAGCGSKKETSKEAKTYDCSKEYETAMAHLEDIIVEDDIYSDLSEALGAFKDEDVTKLSKKDAKTLKSTAEEVEDYYEASAQVLQDALRQIGEVYPTEDGFYDDTFKSATVPLFEELNTLIDAGHYKDAAAKLEEITASYTAYVEGKGVTVTAEIGVDATRTTSAKEQITRAKAANNKSGKGNTVTASTGAVAGASTSAGGSDAGDDPFITETVICDHCGQSVTLVGRKADRAYSMQNHRQSSSCKTREEGLKEIADRQAYVKTWTCPECGETLEIDTMYINYDDAIQHHKDSEYEVAKGKALNYEIEASNAYDEYVKTLWDEESQTYKGAMTFDEWLVTSPYDKNLIYANREKYKY